MAKAKTTAEDEARAAAQAEHEAVVETFTGVLELSGERAERLACLSDPPVELPAALVCESRPTIGRVVHYHTHVKTYPAIIVDVARAGGQEFVDLAVFGSPFGTFASRLRVLSGEPGRNNTWSWPPLAEPLPEIEEAEEAAGE